MHYRVMFEYNPKYTGTVKPTDYHVYDVRQYVIVGFVDEMGL